MKSKFLLSVLSVCLSSVCRVAVFAAAALPVAAMAQSPTVVPDAVKRQGFGEPHQIRSVQMDDDRQPETVMVFSRDNGHYPLFDIFRTYYAVVDSKTGEVQYLSEVGRTINRDLSFDQRDGRAVLVHEYFENGHFTVDRKGGNLQTVWVRETVDLSDGAGAAKKEILPPAKVVLGYVTSWNPAMPDPMLLTHINYAFGHVTESFDGVGVSNPERLHEVVALREKNPRLKVLLSIGGWGSGRFSEMAASEEFRRSFARDARRVVDEFALDGIDIDWEYPTSNVAEISASPDDTANFTLMMHDLRQAIGPDKLLTLATASTAEYIDFRAIDPHIDFVNIMAYDMDHSGERHHSGLYRSERSPEITTHESVEAHLSGGVPAHKLVMGVPFYGRARDELSGFTNYRSIVELKGYERRWDDDAKAPYLVDAAGAMVAGYDDVRSLEIKSAYINDRGLRGVMYWDFAGDTDELTLSHTIWEGMYPTIKTLIVTGQDGSHWWRGGSERLQQILEDTGRFDVDWATTPPAGSDMSGYRPDFSIYDLVVVNYGGQTWDATARVDFEKFVAQGGGVVAVHSSIVPMADWREYNRMIGLGAWDGRNEKDGPWVYWREDPSDAISGGSVVYDRTPGAAGHHALQHRFTVVHRAPRHPALQGLPAVWEHRKDELYGKTRGPAENLTVLATAFDDPAVGGSGRHEPMLWTVDYGRGRVFVTAMGHAGNDPDMRYSMDDESFAETLIRGAEWAAGVR